MSSEKKEAGNRILEQLGINASQAVNRLYDYVIEKRQLPFPEEHVQKQYTQEEIARAMAWVDSLRWTIRTVFANIDPQRGQARASHRARPYGAW